MTTTVKITACCSDKKEVHVTVTDGTNQPELTVIQNGESVEKYAYDAREIIVKEVTK